MPFVPFADGAQLTVKYLWDSQQVQNTLYAHQTPGPVTIESIVALGNAVNTWLTDSFMPQLSRVVTYTSLIVKDLSVENSFELVVNGFGLAGGVDDLTDPNNVTIAASFRTAQSGRSFRGRNYIPGIPKAQIDGNVVNGSFLSNMVVVYNGLQTAIADAGWEWVVASRTLVSGVSGFGVMTPINSVLFTDNIVDSQRRRLPGRGR